MGNKERLKGILERQAAAAERERLDEEAASAKAEKVRSVRVEVIQKWQKQRAHLETYIAQINKETSKNGVQLFVVKNPRHADTGVGMDRPSPAPRSSPADNMPCVKQRDALIFDEFRGLPSLSIGTFRDKAQELRSLAKTFLFTIS